AQHPGEAQRQSSGVAGRALNAVEGDLDDLLGTHEDDVTLAVCLQLQEAAGLPLEHLVGHPLERLAQHDEAVAVARPEVDVRQPSPAAAAAPLDGEDDEVQRVARLDLDPCGAAAPGVVRGGEVLQYDALVPLVEDRAVEVGEL